MHIATRRLNDEGTEDKNYAWQNDLLHLISSMDVIFSSLPLHIRHPFCSMSHLVTPIFSNQKGWQQRKIQTNEQILNTRRERKLLKNEQKCEDMEWFKLSVNAHRPAYS